MVEDRKSSHTATMLALRCLKELGTRVVCRSWYSKDLCQFSEASHRGRSVAFVDNLECSVVEFDWTRQCVPGRVGELNHRGRLAVGKKLRFHRSLYRRSTPRRIEPAACCGASKVRLMPALILTAGGNPVTIWTLTVWDVVSFAKKYADGLWFGPSGSPGEHRTALITSPGLTGRATCAMWRSRSQQ